MGEENESNEFQPWLEKYRPRKLDEVIGQPQAVERMKAFLKSKNIPHMMLAGPAGVGKTSVSLALAHELYGDAIGQCFLELNASDERGIDVVRGRVKDFARTMPLSDVPYRLILLDEADSLTDDAQHALRRTMEKYSEHTRFALSCVAPETKIILPEEVETTIGDFEKRLQLGVLSMDEVEKKVVREKVLCYTKLDPKIIGKRSMKIETMTGRAIQLTEDHKLLTKRGWVEAGSLGLGDAVSVFPALEETPLENDVRIVIDELEFKKFLNEREIRYGGRRKEAATFFALPTLEKQKIIERVQTLYAAIPSCLTKREKDTYDIVAKTTGISRLEIQKLLGLSRIRTVQLLHKLEAKGWLNRTIVDKIHSFTVAKLGAEKLRNKVDIQNKIAEEFEVRISYSTIKKIAEGKRNERYLSQHVLNELERVGLLPLHYSSSKIGLASRLFGFLLGDGHITKSGRLIFTTDAKSLAIIRNEIEALGFSPSKIMSKKLDNEIGGRRVIGTTTWFYVDSSALAQFFEFLGAPNGDKCLKEFEVPAWIRNGTRLVKREFLRAIFGCEMYSPKTSGPTAFAALPFRQHKRIELVEQGQKFMHQMVQLLGDFGVRCTEPMPREVARRKSGQRMMEVGFWILPETKNIYDFLRKVGYTYAVDKEKEGRLAAEYNRHKLHATKKVAETGMRAVELLLIGNLKKTVIAKQLGCTVDFITNQTEGKAAMVPRNFPTFDEWKQRYAFGNSGAVWNEITKIEEIELNDVRDITCLNNHNFIANGFVSHNCNYSSKIIEPIQSRCAIFRFRPLQNEDVKKIVERIAAAEKINLSEKAMEALVYVADGDARRATNLLQGASVISKDVNEEDVLSLSSRARPKEIGEMLSAALKGSFTDARKQLDELMVRYGMSGEDVISQVYREVTSLPISDNKKVELVDRIGEYDFRISQGADPRIQLEAMIAQIILIGSKP